MSNNDNFNVIDEETKYMSDSYDNKIKLLENILKNGLEKLLLHARQNNILLPPFGRGLEPTPLITEEDFIKIGAWKEEKISETPEYHYEYGFNPIRFLADYIQWAHPKSINDRYINKSNCFERLQSIGSHAKYQLDVLDKLNQRIDSLKSLILWGPFTSPISSNEIVLICQPLRQGTISIDISTSQQFDNEVINKQLEHTPFYKEYKSTTHKYTSSDYPYVFKPFKTTIDGLVPNQKYYLRIRLEQTLQESVDDEESKEDSIIYYDYKYSSFITLPSDQPIETIDIDNDEYKYSPFTLFGVGIDPKLSIDLNIKRDEIYPIISNESSIQPSITCILGDPFIGSKDKAIVTQQIYKDLEIYSNSNSIINNSLLLYAWNDSRSGSLHDLMLEEVAYKKHCHELKKFNKKNKKSNKLTINTKTKKSIDSSLAPVFIRPPPSQSFQTFIEGFPVLPNDSSTINSYRNIKIGLDIEIFLLDCREGYLGKEQSRWLRNNLQTSSALWKIILYASPFGVKIIDNTIESNPVEGSSKSPSHLNIKTNNEHSDIDKEGRNRGNLQYVIAKLQSLFSGKINNDSDGESSVGESSPKQISGSPSKSNFDNSHSDKPIESNEIPIDSGIVILTSGLRNSYIATYDPQSIGSHFACEVMIGSSIITSNSEYNNNIELVSNMEPQFIFGSIDEKVTVSYCSVSLKENGSLLVTLYTKVNNEEVVLYEVVLVVPNVN